MKAIVLFAPHDARYADFPTPTVTPGTVKVAVAYCGLCGSDLHKLEGKSNTRPVRYPVPLGHEISGTVVEVGEGVDSFRVGDAVTVDPNCSCGACEFCQKGLPSFCPNSRGVVKGMADFVVAPVQNVYHLPAGTDLRAAALSEPLSCCLHGLDLLELKVGQSVALVGLGAIGMMMLQLLRHAGAGEIVVLEPNAEKREAALAAGANRFLSPTDTTAVDALCAEMNIDRVIECVGTQPAQQTALRVAGKGATVVFFGVPNAGDTLPLSTYDVFAKELTIRGSFINPHTMRRAIDCLAAGVIDPDGVIAAVLTPEQAEEELKSRTHSRRGKVLVKFQKD